MASAEHGQTSAAPLPPEDLIFRVSLADVGVFERVGRRSSEEINDALGPDWSWDGKRMLDFGCGVGRLLRYLAEEARVAEIEGCDMHEESIAWCKGNLDPPFKFFVNSADPPLAGVDDETYDLVVAISVFTHLASSWSEWLSELQRITKPGGILIATFHGRGMTEAYEVQSGTPFNEEEVGMISLPTGEVGTFASTFHSQWWLETHWGRAFEPISISPDGFCAEPGAGQGLFVGSRRVERVTAEELELADPGDPREALALQRSDRINFEFAQQFREQALDAQLSLAKRFALSDAGARRMLMRSFVGGNRLRRIGSRFREKGER